MVFHTSHPSGDVIRPLLLRSAARMNSREKGKRGEREFAAFLTENGFVARRGQQFAGGTDSPDVKCDMLPHIHFEVKRTETLQLHKALEQARNDASKAKVPVVAHKRNRGEWVAILPMHAFLMMQIGDTA